MENEPNTQIRPSRKVEILAGLMAGTSKDRLMDLKVSEDLKADYDFVVHALYRGRLVESQTYRAN